MSHEQVGKIDKSTWGEGPWQTEPDRIDFTHAGFSCLMNREALCGHWCGYVAVPNGHPAYHKPYDDVDVDFHGGFDLFGIVQRRDLSHTGAGNAG